MGKAGAGQKRRRFAKMSLGVFAVAASITVVAVLAIGFGAAPAPVAENAASHADPNSVATIVLRSNTSGCQQRSFNNQTGQISDQISSRHNDVVLDAKGMPVPTGTVHTLNSMQQIVQMTMVLNQSHRLVKVFRRRRKSCPIESHFFPDALIATLCTVGDQRRLLSPKNCP